MTGSRDALLNERERGSPRRPLTSEQTAQGEEQGWANRPHEDLVRAFRGLIWKGRQEILQEGRKTTAFTPAIMINNAIRDQTSLHMSPDPSDKQRAAFFRPIQDAWYAIAYEHFRWEETGEPAIEQQFAEDDLSVRYQSAQVLREPRPEIIKLDPQQVKILDALAEAADIPHQRGQSELEIPEKLRYYRRYRVGPDGKLF
jgi:hypothetical protein